MNPSQLYKKAFDALVSLGANPFHSSYLAKECLFITQSDPDLVCVGNTKPPEVKENGESCYKHGELICFVSVKHKTAELFNVR